MSSLSMMQFYVVLIVVFALTLLAYSFALRDTRRKPVAMLALALGTTAMVAFLLALTNGMGEPLRKLAITQQTLPENSRWYPFAYKWFTVLGLAILYCVFGLIWLLQALRDGVGYVRESAATRQFTNQSAPKARRSFDWLAIVELVIVHLLAITIIAWAFPKFRCWFQKIRERRK